MELPIYNRTVANQEGISVEIESVVFVPPPPTLQPRPRIRATNSVRILPVDDAPEEIMVEEIVELGGDDRDIEGVPQSQLTILIVDDSSANRSGVLYLDSSLYNPCSTLP